MENEVAFYWHQEEVMVLQLKQRMCVKKSKAIVRVSETRAALYHTVLFFFLCVGEALPYVQLLHHCSWMYENILASLQTCIFILCRSVTKHFVSTCLL